MAHCWTGCGGDTAEPGRVTADTQMGSAAVTQLDFLRDQYAKFNDPNSFWANEKGRITDDINAQKTDKAVEFGTKKQQATEQYALTASQGKLSQDRLIEEQQNETRRAREESSAKQEETRAGSMEDSYAAMSSSMAGGGGRARKNISSKLQRSMKSHNEELSRMLETSRESVTAGEAAMQGTRTSEAMTLSHQNKMGENEMSAGRASLDRDLTKETNRIDQEVSQGKDNLEKEAGQLVSNTISSFLSSSSTWGNRATSANPWQDYMGLDEDGDV
tara:strand:- start:515 stop:1336 length:822 start_codon:yes stop_codon:yes gene_type:complete